ncbi:MAG: NAD-dependent protein deacylase [Candidatus Cloacimonetes bacterium 4572_55]|nr:MAG: NAD-dependent protein deacylase [Candidatus Cloacimonetes bacterium 4572_55]
MCKTIDPNVISYLRQTENCVISTGAGVSVESGIPTFRDALTGFWSNYDPMTLATPTGFRKDPKLVWEWYRFRQGLVMKTKPNPGHYAIAEMEKMFAEFLLITQNIDGLHHRAGSRNLVEIHGNIHRYKCFQEETIVDPLPESDEVPPRCPNCGSYIRPDVVWFGEQLPMEGLEKAEQAITSCDTLISVGTSGAVYPVALFPAQAKHYGAFVIEINLEETPISEIADVSLLGKSGEILPQLVKELKKARE